jgi:hypothetical protein
MMTRIAKKAAAGAVLGEHCSSPAAWVSQARKSRMAWSMSPIGDVKILEKVNVGVAAQVAANVCGVNVSDVNVLATQVDLAGNPVTVCQNDNRPVTISQN